MTEIFIEKCKFSFKHSLFQLLRIFYLNSVSSQSIDECCNYYSGLYFMITNAQFHFVLPESSFCQFDPWEEKLAGD